MAKSKKTLRQLTVIEDARSKELYTADSLFQKGRFSLSLTEQRIILYTISHIKPTDEKFQEYQFKIKDFFDICGIKEHDSYTAVKKIMGELRDKSWWITMEDPNEPGTECESKVNWFTVLRTNKKSGIFTIMFHPDMVPFLLELAKQRAEGKGYYTKYTFQYLLPMRSQYAVRLYELLKTYQKNNYKWWFKVEDLKRLLDCQNYKGFKDFRVRVLEPAVKEINEFTDIKITYGTEKDGRRIDVITFFMAQKSIPERIEAEKKGLTSIDGNTHYWDSEDIVGQINLFDKK